MQREVKETVPWVHYVTLNVVNVVLMPSEFIMGPTDGGGRVAELVGWGQHFTFEFMTKSRNRNIICEKKHIFRHNIFSLLLSLPVGMM